jgi:hypothetical protein
MKIISHLTSLSLTIVSFLTAGGLALHGMHVDQALNTLEYRLVARVQLPETIDVKPGEVKLDLHAHVDQNPAQSLLSLSGNSSTDGMLPRGDYRRGVTSSPTPRSGRHAFDNVYLPIIA